MNELSNVQLEQMARDNGFEVKIYTRDQIPRTKSEKWNILNLDKATGPGTHWTAYKNGKNKIYFDSFGCVPPQELDDIFEDDYIYNTKQIQDLNSSACGWYCMAFIKFMLNPTSLDDISKFKLFTELFSDDTIFNERYLSNMI